MTDATEDISTGEDGDFIEIRSPYRPYPIGAKRDLSDAVSTVVFSDDNPRVAYVSEHPPDELLDNWELDVIRTDSPEEVWETDHGERIEIYSDRVERDGTESTISPTEAKKQARKQKHFTRIDTAGSNDADT